jgi:adenosylmethionine-8-amino-7-oxononanoate aminotransferase
MSPIFVTGTGTGIGKSVVSAVLVRGFAQLGMKPRYWKPVQTGASPEDGDAAFVRRVAGDVVEDAGCLYYPLAASPDQAARAASRPAPSLTALLAALPDGNPVIVEGAGGLLVPLNDAGETWADLPWPVVVVASTELGTINHTSLTLRELERRGRHVLAVVLSGKAHPENLRSLQRQHPGVPFHWLPPVDAQVPGSAPLARAILEQLEAASGDGRVTTAPPPSELPWLEADRLHVWHPYTQHKTAPTPLPVERAHGAHLTLAGGERLIDGTSSWWVNTIGHGRPEIGAAIARQQAKLDHVIFAGVTHEPAARLAFELARLAGAGLSRVFYSDNGSTAVEVALKIVYQSWVNRGEPERTRFLAFRGSYHGDTFGTMAIGAAAGFHGVFKPFLFEVEHALPVTSHRSSVCPDGPAALDERLAQLERTIASQSLAGVVVEPLVQGAGGMLMQPEEFLRGVARICRRHALPLVLDEVMTGFGRTGAAFAFQRAGIEPDLICVAKGLTGGNLPLAATLARESFFAAFASDDRSRALLHGHSYTANPIACAAALASLDILEREQLSQRALDLERRYRGFIEAHAARLGLVAPRALGGILAFELPGTGDGDYFHPRATELAPRARAAGLFVRPLGNTVYLMPPLTIDDATLAAALDALASSVERL